MNQHEQYGKAPTAPARMSARRALLGAGALIALAGCSGATELEPARSANELGDDTAYVETNAVTIVADGDGWSGDDGVQEHVTPVAITIQNGGDRPVRLRYSNVSLVGADGTTYRALPPFDIEGSVDEQVDRLVPRFQHERFAVAPHLGNVYQGLEVEPPLAYADEEYHDHLYDTWRVEIPLPTKYMREVALPEGSVGPGGELSGFVYFERVPESAEHVELQIDLVNAASGESLGTASIPFEVDS